MFLCDPEPYEAPEDGTDPGPEDDEPFLRL